MIVEKISYSKKACEIEFIAKSFIVLNRERSRTLNKGKGI
jgi:hypothetical protein